MISRRDFLQVSMAASAMLGASGFGTWSRLAAQQALTQDQLLEFDPFGNVWIGGNGNGDGHVLRFTNTGRFLAQYGTPGTDRGSTSTSSPSHSVQSSPTLGAT